MFKLIENNYCFSFIILLCLFLNIQIIVNLSFIYNIASCHLSENAFILMNFSHIDVISNQINENQISINTNIVTNYFIMLTLNLLKK